MRTPLALLLLTFAVGCGSSAQPEDLGRAISPLLALTTSKSVYEKDEAVPVTFVDAPASSLNWIALAEPSSSNTSFLTWAYTPNAAAGTVTLSVPGYVGPLEARLFVNDGYERIATSATFQVGPSVLPNQSTYASGADATITFSNVPSTPKDWIGITAVGAPETSLISWAYTGGAPSGSVVLSLVGPPGAYQARLYANDRYELHAASPVFNIASATVVSNQASYALDETATINFAGAQATAKDWIAIAPSGSSAGSYVTWQYTGGVPSGALSFPLSAFAGGSYVARLYANDDFTLQAESAVFVVNGELRALSPDKSSYLATESAIVSFHSAPLTPNEWIALAPVGSPLSTYAAWQYTGASQGTLPFALGNLEPGDYVARLFGYGTYTLLGTSAGFHVSANVLASSSGYGTTEAVSIQFGGGPGNAHDWIAITTPGSPAGSFSAWTYVSGQRSGTHNFGSLPTGTYVARLHADDGSTIVAESPSFVVSACSVGNPDLQSDPSNCGACSHSCLGGTCSAGVCQSVLVAQLSASPYSIEVDADNVYFATYYSPALNEQRSDIARVPVNGGSVFTYATENRYPENVAIDGTHIFWTGLDAVRSCPLSGCAPAPTVIDSLPASREVFRTGPYLFWSNGFGRVHRCTVVGGACTDTLQVATMTGNVPSQVAATPTWVVWNTGPGDGLAYQCKHSLLPGACTTTQIPANPYTLPLTVDAENVYLGDSPPKRCPLTDANGCVTPVDLTSSPTGQINDITVDAADVYWSTNAGVFRCAKTGCTTPTLIASSRGDYLRVRPEAIYWSDRTVNQIKKIAR